MSLNVIIWITFIPLLIVWILLTKVTYKKIFLNSKSSKNRKVIIFTLTQMLLIPLCIFLFFFIGGFLVAVLP